jgi:hypothetical protein
MRTFGGKFYYDQKPLIASRMEFLLQKAYCTVNEKPVLFCKNQLSLSGKLTSQKHKTMLS